MSNILSYIVAVEVIGIVIAFAVAVIQCIYLNIKWHFVYKNKPNKKVIYKEINPNADYLKRNKAGNWEPVVNIKEMK